MHDGAPTHRARRRDARWARPDRCPGPTRPTAAAAPQAAAAAASVELSVTAEEPTSVSSPLLAAATAAATYPAQLPAATRVSAAVAARTATDAARRSRASGAASCASAAAGFAKAAAEREPTTAVLERRAACPRPRRCPRLGRLEEFLPGLDDRPPLFLARTRHPVRSGWRRVAVLGPLALSPAQAATHV